MFLVHRCFLLCMYCLIYILTIRMVFFITKNFIFFGP
nr:hypothetical protein CoNPh37_CDS0081 [Staphylococcus phage S-CoN_Ph37]